MPFAATCVDVVGTCGNAIPRVEIGQNVEGEVRVPLVDPNLNGGPVDLTQYGINGSSSSSSSSGEAVTGVRFVVKEMENSANPYFSVYGEVKSEEDARNGIVYLNFEGCMSARPGIWIGMASVFQEGVQKKNLPFYLEVTPDLATYNASGAPLTFYEVRLAVRDVCPEVNILLDAVDFQPVEIAGALRWPIEYWNEEYGHIQLYTPMTFPYRYHWRMATVGELMRIVGIWMMRNHLDYSIAGLTVKDSSRWPEYIKMGEAKIAEYKEYAKRQAVTVNAGRAYRSIGGWCPPPYR